MIITRRELATAVAAALPFAVAGKAAGAGDDIDRPGARVLQSKLTPLLDVTAVPGFAAGVLRNGKLAWERYQGVVEAGTRRPVHAETLFPAAPLGTPVLAYAVLGLAEQGRLDLDRPLKSYVPDHAPADPRAEKITARHVLTHSSRLRNWRNALDQPLVPELDPGSRFQYSGEGFYYLQRAVEKIAGCAIQPFMEDTLFQRFGMASSSYAWRADTEQRLWLGHNRGAVVRGSRDLAIRLLAYAEQQRKPMS